MGCALTSACQSADTGSEGNPAAAARRRSSLAEQQEEDDFNDAGAVIQPGVGHGFYGRLDELVARMLHEEELAARMITSSQSSRRPAPRRGLSMAEIEAATGTLRLQTPPGPGDSGETPGRVPSPHPSGPTPCNDPGDIPGQECVLCLEEYTCGDALRVLRCRHFFHSHCIDGWLQRSRTCPLCCRDVTQMVPKQADAHHVASPVLSSSSYSPGSSPGGAHVELPFGRVMPPAAAAENTG